MSWLPEISAEGLDCGLLDRSAPGRVDYCIMRIHSRCAYICTYARLLLELRHSRPFFYQICLSGLCLRSCWNMSRQSSSHSCVFVHVCMRMFVFRSIYKPASSVAFVPSVGRELPSHYSGSTTSLRLCVSVSPNLPLFSLLSLVISLFHSLRQLPPPSGSQSILISFSFAPYLLCSPVNLFLFLTITL